MTESETESETIDRLEAALRKIATAAQAAKITAAHAAKITAAQAPKWAPPAPPAAPQIDTDALKQSLDLIIARLRAGLAPPAHHVITE